MGKKWKILRRELLPQFLTDSHGIWHRCLPWGVDVQDIFFDSGRKCVAMVTAYYGQKIGGNLASRTTVRAEIFAVVLFSRISRIAFEPRK